MKGLVTVLTGLAGFTLGVGALTKCLFDDPARYGFKPLEEGDDGFDEWEDRIQPKRSGRYPYAKSDSKLPKHARVHTTSMGLSDESLVAIANNSFWCASIRFKDEERGEYAIEGTASEAISSLVKKVADCEKLPKDFSVEDWLYDGGRNFGIKIDQVGSTANGKFIDSGLITLKIGNDIVGEASDQFIWDFVIETDQYRVIVYRCLYDGTGIFSLLSRPSNGIRLAVQYATSEPIEHHTVVDFESFSEMADYLNEELDNPLSYSDLAKAKEYFEKFEKEVSVYKLTEKDGAVVTIWQY